MHVDLPVTPRRFLFVTWEGGGNVPPILGLARRLVQRGHDVRVMSDPCNEDEVRAAGCEFTPYARAPHRTDKSAASTLLRDYEASNALAGLRSGVQVWWRASFAQDVLEELTVRPVDVCCINDILFTAFFAAEKAGVPAVLLMPNCNELLPGSRTDLAGRAKATFRTFLFQRVLLRQAIADLQDVRKVLGLPSVRDYFTYFQQRAKFLIMTSRAFDSTAEMGPNYRYVGPVLDDPIWAEAWQSPWPADHADPLVVVSLSTTYQQQEDALQRVMDAMDGLNVRGLVTLGPALDHTRFRAPSNVVIRQSAPHAQVFPLAAAVVSHCGHGTVMRALAHGIPLVCMPFGRDQPANADRVVARGAGLKLDRKADVAGIREAIQRVIEEPAFRENAGRLGRKIAEDARNSIGIHELEQVAGATRAALVTA